MRLSLRNHSHLVRTVPAALLLVAVLLFGAVPVASQSPTTPAIPQSLELTTPSHNHPTPGLTESAMNPPPVGHVVESPLLDYNTTIPGNFGSSVWDWSVGPGTFVTSTGDLWLANNLTQAYRGASPLTAPAIIYNTTTNTFVGVERALIDTTNLLFDPANGLIYSTDPGNSTVGVFNPTTGSWVATIPVGTDPSALAIDSLNSTLFVANAGSDNITVIDTQSEQVVPVTISTGHSPSALAYSALNSAIFVACRGATFLYEVNATSYGVSTPLALVADADGVAVSLEANSVAVTIPSRNFLVVANASSFASLPYPAVGLGGQAVVTSTDGSSFVVSNPSHNRVSTVNATTAALTHASIPVGSNPVGLFTDTGNGLIYSWSSIYRNLTPLEPATGVLLPASPTLGVRPIATSYNPSSNQVIVADALTNSLIVLNAESFDSAAPPIPLPAAPYALADDAETSTVYVGLNGSIATFDSTTSLLGSLNVTVPGANGALLVDEVDGLLWDMNNISGLIAFHLSTLRPSYTTTIGPDTGGAPSLTLDPVTGQLFTVTTGVSGPEVSVIDASTGSTVNAGIPAGSNSTAVEFDPADNQVYVLGANITTIDAGTLVIAPQSIYLPAHVLAGASIAYEPTREFLYVTTSPGVGSVGQVTLIDGSSLAASYGTTGTIYLGYEPTALLAVNYPDGGAPGSGVLVVANLNSGSLGVIATSPPVINFFESAPEVIDVGQSTTFLLQYIGGAGAVQIAYNGLPTGCVSSDTVVLGCLPSTPGFFTIGVTVTDSLGGVGTTTATLTVETGLTVGANFTAPTFPELDVGYVFTAIAVVAGGAPAYSETWNFGDGTSSHSVASTHTYTQPGVYTLSLTVQDNFQQTGTVAWAVLVNPAPGVVVSAPSAVTDVNQTLAFGSSATEGTGLGTSNWTFGDGSVATGPTETHTWSSPGTYLVTVHYSDSLGVAAFSSVTITVNPALTGSFSESPELSSATTGAVLQFKSLPSGGTPPYSVVWSFGDGSGTLGLNVTHTFGAAGNYTVVVTVTDKAGAKLNGTLTILVTAPTASSSTSASPLNFPLGIFLGVLAGAAIAAIVVYAAGPRRPKSQSPSPHPPSPYVPPATEEWKED